ncbi:MAG: flavodoxin family protein, partial [Acidimicrobiia bacterium]
LIVYESMFGNTLDVAEAILDGIATRVQATAVEVGAAPESPGDDVTLLIVGGPTHAFTMSRSTSRESAKEETGEPLVSTGIGIREWLDGLPKIRSSTTGATFDTKVDKPRLPGSAAAAAEKRLRKAGCTIVDEHQSFYVDGMTGPLIDGELDSAREWGRSLGAKMAMSESGA